MNTRTALAALGAQPPEGLLTQAHGARFARKAQAVSDALTPTAPADALPLEAACEPDPAAPVIDLAQANRMANQAVDQLPQDRALRQVAANLAKSLERNPLGNVTVRQCRQLQAAYDSHPVRTLIEDFARRGHAVIDGRKAARLAAGIHDQASFDTIMNRSGYVSQRPDHIQMRALVAHLVTRRLAGDDVAAGDPFEVAVADQPGDVVSQPSDGALSIRAAYQRALLGQRVGSQANNLQIIDGRVVLRIAGQTQTHGMHRLLGALRHLTQYEPTIHQQQDRAVDLSPEEGAALLGKDSQTDPGFETPGIKQKPGMQPGTSTSVVAYVLAPLVCLTDGCGERRKLAMSHTPSFVAQPALWRRAMRAKTYARAVKAYTEECKALGLSPEHRTASAAERYNCPRCRQASMVVLAGGAETLGTDTSVKEVSWLPGGAPKAQHPATDQAGTSLPDKGQATEKDHQRDVPAWADAGTIETSRGGPTAMIQDVTPSYRIRAGLEALATRPGAGLIRRAMTQSDWEGFGFSQIGEGKIAADGVHYRFAHRASLTPSAGDLQNFISAHDDGRWTVASISQVEPGHIAARLTARSEGNPYANRAQKAACIRAALNPQAQLEPAGGGEQGNQGGQGMASDFTGSPGQMTAETTAPVKPVDAPKPTPKGMTASKQAASINEGWGDGGTFERSVDAESSEDLWKIYQGLQGKEPSWPAAGGAPVREGQAGTAPAAPEMGPDGAPLNAPQEPIPGAEGEATMPEPEPDTLEGQAMQPDEDMLQAASLGGCQVTGTQPTAC